MDALKSIFSNEHSLFGLLLVVAATTLTAIGIMPLAQWTSYSEWIFGIYVGGHSVITVGGAVAARGAASAAAPADPAKAPQAGHVSLSMMLALVFVLLVGACAWWHGSSATSQGAHAGAACAVSDLEAYTKGGIAALSQDGFDQAVKDMQAKEHITADVMKCVITSIVTAISAQQSGASTMQPTPVLIHGRQWLDAHK